MYFSKVEYPCERTQQHGNSVMVEREHGKKSLQKPCLLLFLHLSFQLHNAIYVLFTKYTLIRNYISDLCLSFHLFLYESVEVYAMYRLVAVETKSKPQNS